MKKLFLVLTSFVIMFLQLYSRDEDNIADWDVNDNNQMVNKKTGETLTIREYLDRSDWKYEDGEMINKKTGERRSTTTKLKGDILFGNNFGLSYDGGNTISGGTKVNSDPSEIGFSYGLSTYFLTSDKFAVGMGLEYSFDFSKDKDAVPNPTKNIEHEFSISPGIRFMQPLGINKRGGLQEQFDLNIGYGAAKWDNGISEFQDRSISAGMGFSFGGYYETSPCTRIYATAGVMGFDWTKTFPKGNMDEGTNAFSMNSFIKNTCLKFGVDINLNSGNHISQIEYDRLTRPNF